MHCPISGTSWTKVFSHDTSGGLFTSDADALSKNKGNTSAKLFSILDTLESFRLPSGVFHLMLCYPELAGKCNEWKQTSNPATTTTAITGFEAIKLSFPQRSGGSSFRGLGRSPSSSTFIDDSPLSGYWWTAIGVKRKFLSDTIPGPVLNWNKRQWYPVKKVELYAERFWTKVFSHDTSGGLFTSDADALSKNKNKSSAKLFSILDTLEQFRLPNGAFHLKLCYPELAGKCNEWNQNSNPATKSTITGFQAIHLAFSRRSTGSSFKGLGISPPSKSWTFIDDYPEHSDWWNAIGAKHYFGTGKIPGPYKKVEIYARHP